MITWADAFDGMGDGGLGGGVDELAVVPQLDFDRLLIGSSGVDGHGDIGGRFDFLLVKRCDDSHPRIRSCGIDTHRSTEVCEVAQHFGIELMPALEVEVALHVSADVVGVHDVSIQRPLLHSGD